MTSRTLRRTLAPCFLLLALAACGRSPSGEPVQAGAAGAAAGATSTTVGSSPKVASSVTGLSPLQVREAVQAVVPATTRRATGPVAEPVALAGGRTVWRVRLPGRFAVRGAQVRVLVDGRPLGAGIVTPGLDALVVVTPDASRLRAGASVAYQWEGSPPVAAGRLAVTR